MTFGKFLTQEAKWAAKNNPSLKKIIEDNLRYIAKDRPMPPITSQNAAFNAKIWKKYLDGLLPDAPEGKVDWSKPTTSDPAAGLNKLVEDGPAPDYLTDPAYWALQGEGPEWLSNAEHTLDFYGEEPFTEVSLKHEEYRTYIYGDGVEFTINEPVWLITDHSAPEKHIVEDATAVYEVRPGWLAIKKGY